MQQAGAAEAAEHQYLSFSDMNPCGNSLRKIYLLRYIIVVIAVLLGKEKSVFIKIRCLYLLVS